MSFYLSPCLNSFGTSFCWTFLLDNFCVAQAVLETVARVKSKKNDSKEEKYKLLSCKLVAFLFSFWCLSWFLHLLGIYCCCIIWNNSLVNLILGCLNFNMFSIWTMIMEQKIPQHWLIERYHWFIGSFPELVALLVLYLLNNCLFQDNVFIISNFKSKYPVLQLDLR